jgi:ribonuclease VapC
VKRWLLDTSALLTLRDDEPGAQQVADLLAAALAQQAECHACFMTLMELTYRVWMDEGEPAARLAHEQCLSLPLQWVHESPPLLWEAARLKAMHRMSIADAWIAAAARLAGATLVHKDPEFVPLALPQLQLPLKA